MRPERRFKPGMDGGLTARRLGQPATPSKDVRNFVQTMGSTSALYVSNRYCCSVILYNGNKVGLFKSPAFFARHKRSSFSARLKEGACVCVGRLLESAWLKGSILRYSNRASPNCAVGLSGEMLD